MPPRRRGPRRRTSRADAGLAYAAPMATISRSSTGEAAPAAQGREGGVSAAPPACAIDPDTECPVCAARGRRVRMLPVKAHYQCPECRYFDSCCM